MNARVGTPEHLADLILEALQAASAAGFRSGRYASGHGLESEYSEAQRASQEATTALWSTFYQVVAK